ncbi:MAG: arginine deiminase family protein [Candidatus Krumholzibacteriia bacterium]|nr:arginine deiminase [Candidatus Latescibacterota bacterium]
MDAPLALDLRSEVGRLEAVLLHEPGPEIENMAPRHAARALYSDILSRRAALRDYAEMRGVLERVAQCFQLRDLLAEVLADPNVSEGLVETICRNEGQSTLRPALAALEPAELARQLIEGVVLPQDTLTRFLTDERYALQPLHNLFFMRDTGAALGERFVSARMANAVREREALLVATVMRHHPRFRAPVVELPLGLDRSGDVSVEGGDLLVAREDLLIVGLGARTSPQAVDCIVSACHDRHERWDLVIQELPREPESFIHLDMVFTLLDRDACLVYEPVLLRPNPLQTVHMRIEGGRVTGIRRETNLLDTLRRLGLDLEPVLCGGAGDAWVQEREQWHSGANAFAVAPGQVLMYGRNQRTVEELDRHGFAVIEAAELLAGRAALPEAGRAVVTIGGAELARGGGGCRCMTLPLRRAPLG